MNKSSNKLAITELPTTAKAIGIAYGVLVIIALLYFTLAQPASITIIGGTLLLAFLPVLFMRIEYTLLTLIIIRPLIDIYSSYTVLTLGSIQLNMNALLGGMVCVWGVLMILHERVNIRSVPGIWWIGGFMSIGMLGIFIGVDSFQTFSEVVRVGSLLVMYILGWHVAVKNQHFVVWVINGVAASICIPIIVAFYQLITFSGLSFGNLTNRVYGTFGHPNVLGFYLVLVLVIVFVKYITAPPHQRSLVYPWILVSGMIALLFTYTRGAWIGLVISLIVLGLGRYHKHLIIGGATVLLLVISWQGVNALVLNIFNVSLDDIPVVSRITSRDEEADSIDFRLDTYNAMAPRILDNPVFGHGLGTFVILRKQGNLGLFDDPEAHNDYLRLAVEVGLLGVGLYLLFFASLFRRAIINFLIAKSGSWQKNYTLGGIAILCAFGAMSVSDNILQGTALTWASMLVIGSILAIVRPRG